MPNAATNTYTSLKLEPAIHPDDAVIHGLPLTSGSYSRGQVLGKVTATGKYAPYDDALSDGRQVARAIAAYAMTVDASGNITLGGEQGTTRLVAPCYLDGYFRTEDLVGLDANAVTDLGRLVLGTTTTGLLKIY